MAKIAGKIYENDSRKGRLKKKTNRKQFCK